MAIDGILTINGKRIYSVDAEPDFAAPIGSVALVNDAGDGTMWVKTGSEDTDWTQVSSEAV